MRLLCFLELFFHYTFRPLPQFFHLYMPVYSPKETWDRAIGIDISPYVYRNTSSSNKPTAVAAPLRGVRIKGLKKYICQRVKPHMHGDDIGRHNLWG